MDPILLLAGAVVSFLTLVIKRYFGTTPVGTLGAVLGLSVISGVAMWYLQSKGLWEAFLQIVMAAGAVYGFIIKNVQDGLKA